jgi:hypothetical protein
MGYELTALTILFWSCAELEGVRSQSGTMAGFSRHVVTCRVRYARHALTNWSRGRCSSCSSQRQPSTTSPARSMQAKNDEAARRGLPSSRRFSQALTATPLRPAMVVRFACMGRDNLKEADMPHVLIPDDIRERLLANVARSASGADIDPVPLVKLFTPDANATWLLTKIDREATDLAFGLCCLGLGSPELGSVSLSELACIRGPMGLPVERDEHYRETRTISAIARLARKAGHVRV